MDVKPPATDPISTTIANTMSLAVAPLIEFTCSICLDTPCFMTDVASISGCKHTFCFDCIDKWAEIENKCPLCKTAFRTIDRVVALPMEDAAANNSMESARESSSANTSNCGPINSRTVEDRSQGDDTPSPFVLFLFDLAISVARSIDMEVLGLSIGFEDVDLVIRVNTPSGWIDLLSLAPDASSDSDDLVIRLNTQPGWIDLFSFAPDASSDSGDPSYSDDSSQSESESDADDSIHASEESGASSMSGIVMGIERLSTDPDITREH